MCPIQASAGSLLRMRDRNGNELTFHHDAIESNRGRTVQIERDHRLRIKAITDPRGNSVLPL